jgi:hypothetical protein
MELLITEHQRMQFGRSGIMKTVCYEIKDFEEIRPELEFVLGRLGDNLIGQGLLWI